MREPRGYHGVGSVEIGWPEHSTNGDDLVFGVDVQIAGAFDHQIAVHQDVGDAGRDGGGQSDVGTLIYGELELLPPPSVKPDAVNPALRFAPVTITKQWREKLSQDQVAEGLMPRVVETLAEVEAAGGTTRWLGSEMPDNLWEPSARCIFLIERPEGNDHPGFALELDGRQFAVAIYYAAGGAFRDSARVIFNTAMTSLLVPMLDAENKPVINKGRPVKKPMLYKCFWRLTFAKKQAGNFTPWRPTVKLLSKEETGPEVRAYCENLLQNSADNTAVAAE